MPTTLAFAPRPDDLTDIFLEAPILCQSPQPPATLPEADEDTSPPDPAPPEA